MNQKKIIAVIDGDGIGPEVIAQSIKVLNAIAHRFQYNFEYNHALMGAVAIDETGNPLPQKTIDVCMASDAILFGAIGHPKYDNDPSAKVRPEQGLLGLRKALELYANIRPVTAYTALHHLSPLKISNIDGVDLVIYRELTGGIYFGKKEINETKTIAIDECKYSKEEIVRISHLAFSAAQKRRKKITLIDKANVLETSRLWRLIVKEIALEYEDVELDFLFVDNAAMQIILNPKQFDVILTENMFGDIISDEASVIAGSLGMLPSASLGNKYALFEPIHGSYPQAAGKDIANPIGSILSTAMMLDYFNMNEAATLIREATEWAIANSYVTKDIDPVNFYFTSTIGDIISEYICSAEHGIVNIDNILLRKSTVI
ncbi:MAG: 3-isopropylmalate dehydrogenase [Ferruginibacter sp.]|nr:3-isopropylmalate dehydrogenase [Ferruginibacter sp.]